MLKKPIVIEGPDGAGKSTLIKRLSNDLQVRPHHTGGPSISTKEFRDRITVVYNMKLLRIFDRLPMISERIYRSIDNKPLPISIEEMDHHLQAVDPLVIFCRRKNLTDMYRAIDRTNKPHKPADFTQQVVERYRDVVAAYDKFMSETPVDVYHYDWEVHDYNSLLKYLQSHCEE